jgi:ADP-heptose:LPS heptosyltransferase
LPVIPDIAAYLAVLARARVFVTGDTGPLHFAVALKVPTVSLWGPSPFEQWHPREKPHQVLRSERCQCPGYFHVCDKNNLCMKTISAERVLAAVELILHGASAAV